jgi:hypothetical protein
MQRVVNRLSTAFNCQSTTNDAGLEIPRQIRTLTVVGWDQTNPVSTLSFPPTFLSILQGTGTTLIRIASSNYPIETLSMIYSVSPSSKDNSSLCKQNQPMKPSSYTPQRVGMNDSSGNTYVLSCVIVESSNNVDVT